MSFEILTLWLINSFKQKKKKEQQNNKQMEEIFLDKRIFLLPKIVKLK